MRLEEQLDKFLVEWGGTRVLKDENRLIYKVTPSYAKRSANRANELIEILGLDLVAIPSTNYPQDSFVVQSLK